MKYFLKLNYSILYLINYATWCLYFNSTFMHFRIKLQGVIVGYLYYSIEMIKDLGYFSPRTISL